METRILDISCTGANGKVYEGQFEVKLFLTHKENAEVARNRNKNIAGLVTTPFWDVGGFFAELQDKSDNTVEEAKLVLSEKQIIGVMNLVNKYLPAGDPEADIIAAIARLNGHIISSPSWWGNGYDLVDFIPVIELNNQLKQLQANEVKA